MAHPSETAIREQAYYLWEQDGRPHGREMEYWSRATVAVSETANLKALTKAPPKKAAKLVTAAPKAEAKKAVAPKLKATAPKLKAAATKVKAAPAKSTKAAPKAKPKKK